MDRHFSSICVSFDFVSTYVAVANTLSNSFRLPVAISGDRDHYPTVNYFLC